MVPKVKSKSNREDLESEAEKSSERTLERCQRYFNVSSTTANTEVKANSQDDANNEIMHSPTK